MMTKKLTLLLLSYLVVLISTPATSQVIYGIGNMNAGGWDFSDSTTAEAQTADIHVIIVRLIANKSAFPYFVCGNADYGSKVIAVPDSTFEELKYAPGDSTEYSYTVDAFEGRTYVVCTIEGHYAKFRFTYVGSYMPPTIEYVYQPDGSRKLFDTTGTETCSWGKIRKLGASRKHVR